MGKIFQKTLDAFISYLKNEKRFSSHTVISYRHDLEQFFMYAGTEYSAKSLEDISHPYIRSWVVSLMNEKMSPRSINRKITTLKTFYKFLLKQKLVTVNPMLKVQAPKISKRLPVFVDRPKMDLLLDGIKFGNNFPGRRDRLMLEMLYATGMRLSELIGLKDSGIDMGTLTLKVLGKRNKERLIPFGENLEKLIVEYKNVRSEILQGGKDGYFFRTDSGKKMYPMFVQRKVKQYLSTILSTGKRSPHILRHTFATHMLDEGADLNAIKELLGHANLSATQVYTHNTVEKLKNIHRKAHPKA